MSCVVPTASCPNRSAWPRAAGAQAVPLAVGAGLIEPQAQAYYARANGLFKAHGLGVNIVVSAKRRGHVGGGCGGIDRDRDHERSRASAGGGTGLAVRHLRAGRRSRFAFPGQRIARPARFEGREREGPGRASRRRLHRQRARSTRPPEMLAALQAGRIDAMNLEDPEFSAARSATRWATARTRSANCSSRRPGSRRALWLAQNLDTARACQPQSQHVQPARPR